MVSSQLAQARGPNPSSKKREIKKEVEKVKEV
jgi:hypothetical protein